jgi:predicted metal-dependent HD superfamily phosphohydrolase
MLKSNFINLVNQYSKDIMLGNFLWKEIESNYNNNNRYYHTMYHLDSIFNLLIDFKKGINDWETIIFSIVYHDIIYNIQSKTNEEDSAEFAISRLEKISYPTIKIERCAVQILSTKGHTNSIDNDTDYFLDADIGILGASWEAYTNYFQNIRKEYSIYPTDEYNYGRSKVLNQFLKLDRIYKTNEFYSKFEKNARNNLQREIFEIS